MNQKKVVLAYSGGLDTTFCIKHLTLERNLEVHAILVDTGGFSDEEINEIERKAMAFGAASFKAARIVEHFYDKCIKYLIYGNMLRNNTYPMSVSAERVFQALEVIKHANTLDAEYIAHGSTGAGNDQVRFDLAFHILGKPDIEIITPIRDLKLSRQDEIEKLKSWGVEMSWEKAKYSINKGIWGTSVGGDETLTSHLSLPEDAYPTPVTETTSKTVELVFEKGELVGVNNQKFDKSHQAIQHLQSLAEPFGIGRDIHVGDTIIGIKGRVGFEAAAPLIILKAHHLLEKHTLTKWQAYHKEQMANWYGMQLHEGQYLEPLMRNIEVFLESTQTTVSGTVFVKLHPYRFELIGISSELDLMKSKFGSYGEMNKGYTGDDVRGFTKIIANSSKIHSAVHPDFHDIK